MQPIGDRCAARIGIDQLDVNARYASRERGRDTADHASANNSNAIAQTRRRIP